MIIILVLSNLCSDDDDDVPTLFCHLVGPLTEVSSSDSDLESNDEGYTADNSNTVDYSTKLSWLFGESDSRRIDFCEVVI